MLPLRALDLLFLPLGFIILCPIFTTNTSEYDTFIEMKLKLIILIRPESDCV